VRFTLLLTVLVLLAHSAGASVTARVTGVEPVESVKSQRGTRTIRRPQGVSIRSLLRPSDETVVIEEGVIWGPPLNVVFANKREAEEFELELLSRRDNALLLVRVESVDAALDATESWITSTARMKILEISPGGAAPLDGTWGDATFDTTNRDMTWRFDGGEMRFGKTLVSAGDFFVWEPKATYLISFFIHQEEKATHMGIVYQVGANGRLVVQRGARGSFMRTPDALKGRRLSDVRKSIEKF
jgi:hypothetical protein